MSEQRIVFSVDVEGIAVLRFDTPGHGTNLLDRPALAAFSNAVTRALDDRSVNGLLIASAKQDFIAGADLAMLMDLPDRAQLFEATMDLQRLLRRLETDGRPVAAAINGTALGGGFEICLACHYRVAADVPQAQIGLPEVTLGLLPGAGGTQRLPRLLGIRTALPLLLEGGRLSPGEARELGLVDELVPPGQEEAAARRWLGSHFGERVAQPWDRKGYRVPGGAVQSPAGVQTFMAGNALLRARTWGTLPAPVHLMASVYEGMHCGIDAGLRNEARHFVALAGGAQARNTIRTMFFGVREAAALASRPRDVTVKKVRRAGVLGAGMMGAGIAHVAALAGIDTVLVDVSREQAERGKANARRLLEKQVQRGRMDRTEMERTAARIHPTARYADLTGCELVIEAVFEDRELKARVTREAERFLPVDALFASNTSTLPIAGLARASERPANFIGLHFFSPVHRMKLVEVIVAEHTSHETLAHALDFVAALRKCPIVVRDARGFYTSRVFSTYVREGLQMLADGVRPALIDNAGRLAGMPVGPLALADELSLATILRVNRQNAADLGARYQRSAADEVVESMVEQFDRAGRSAGGGFYDYSQDGRWLWDGLDAAFPPAARQPEVAELIRRLLYVQSLETARCIEERVITSARDADVGSILGWGFPAARGGTAGQIDTVGVTRFVVRCDELAGRCGARFSPPDLLRRVAVNGGRFADARG